MKLFTALATAAITLTGFAANAQASTCTFNGNTETCTVTRFDQGDTSSVIWSDGKIVNYTRFGCVDNTCGVQIVEDNGRVTFGTGSFGRRGFAVRSNRGNLTSVNY